MARGRAAEARGDLVVAALIFRAVATGGDPRERPEAEFHLARVAWRQGQYDVALAGFEQARAAALSSGNVDLRARAENGIGAVHYARGAYTLARASYEVALELTDDVGVQAKVSMNLGVIANIAGDYGRAFRLYTRARTQFAEAGDEGGEAMALHNLGMLHADQGRLEEADDCYTACLAAGERLGDRQLIATVLVDRCELCCRRGDPASAVATADLALAIYASLGDEVGRGEGLRWRGVALAGVGNRTAALTAFAEAIRIAGRHDLRLLEAEVAEEMAAVTRDAGDRGAAQTWAVHAFNLFTALGARRDAERSGRLVESLTPPGG